MHRKDSVGSVEKAITIYGQPENCSNACLQIIKVMQEEARNTEKSEDIPLKILAHNNLIGRIIGKQGKYHEKKQRKPSFPDKLSIDVCVYFLSVRVKSFWDSQPIRKQLFVSNRSRT